MKTKRVMLGLAIASFAGWVGISLADTGEVQQTPPVSHASAPSFNCLDCHGTHPTATNTEEGAGGGGGLTIPSIDVVMELACSQCHSASEEATLAANPSSCVGCHVIGGYPLKAALEALVGAGHPNVIPMTKTVPGSCFMCHEETLGLLMHRLHLVESPAFTEHFPSGCLRCHLLGEDGTVSVEDLPIE
ncbi:cytochrome c3 family protein [Candidatus Bipolaricaulota bacterium]